MALIVAGVSHRTAALDVREKLALRTGEITALLERLIAEVNVREGVMLSTCNRTEVYLVEGDRDAVAAVWGAFSQRLDQDAAGYGYVLRDRDAAAHLFRVASGLDSMVLGEAQIHGQVRTAWESCRAQSGAVLNRLFRRLLAVGCGARCAMRRLWLEAPLR